MSQINRTIAFTMSGLQSLYYFKSSENNISDGIQTMHGINDLLFPFPKLHFTTVSISPDLKFMCQAVNNNKDNNENNENNKNKFKKYEKYNENDIHNALISQSNTLSETRFEDGKFLIEFNIFKGNCKENLVSDAFQRVGL